MEHDHPGVQGAERRQRVGEPLGVAFEACGEMLDEVHLVHVALFDGSLNGCDRGGVLVLGPRPRPLSDPELPAGLRSAGGPNLASGERERARLRRIRVRLAPKPA